MANEVKKRVAYIHNDQTTAESPWSVVVVDRLESGDSVSVHSESCPLRFDCEEVANDYGVHEIHFI